MKRTKKQGEAVMINFAIKSFMGLQRVLRLTGHYDFEQRVRELEEQFRHLTGRKERNK